MEDLQKLVASPLVTENEFPSTFLKALATSGVETKLKNCVFHLMRSKGLEKWIQEQHSGRVREPLAYIAKVQSQWEKRVLKSLNSMCMELGQSLAKPRCQNEQQELITHWNDLSSMDMDLSLFRPVYSPKDFLEVLAQLHSPNQVAQVSGQMGRPFGLVQVPLKTASLEELMERFGEMSRAEAHLGVSPGAPSQDEPSLTLEQERQQLGLKVLEMDHAPLSQEFLKRGCPPSLRGSIWSQVLGSQALDKDVLYHNELKEAVVTTDIMLDKLIIKDVQLTVSNDDQYFVFEDMIFQIMLCFSRDTEVAEIFSCGSSNPAKAMLRGRSGGTENLVIYPPSGVIPFHGFSMFCAPFCYVYEEPAKMYFTFRAMYLRFFFRLHQVSSHPQSILGLCALFENIIQKHEPDLWIHMLSCDIQPTRVVFRWIMRGFSGHFPPFQLLFLWDLVLAYDSMELFPLLAASILSFRKENLMRVNTMVGVETVLADLSSLPVVPLLQLALARHASNSK